MILQPLKLKGFFVFLLLLVFVSTGVESGAGGVVTGDLYESKCANCHGVGGKGTAMGPPHIDSKFLRNASDEEVFKVVKYGRRASEKQYKKIALPMPPWRDRLTDEEISALVEYMKALNK